MNTDLATMDRDRDAERDTDRDTNMVNEVITILTITQKPTN